MTVTQQLTNGIVAAPPPPYGGGSSAPQQGTVGWTEHSAYHSSGCCSMQNGGDPNIDIADPHHHHHHHGHESTDNWTHFPSSSSVLLSNKSPSSGPAHSPAHSHAYNPPANWNSISAPSSLASTPISERHNQRNFSKTPPPRYNRPAVEGELTRHTPPGYRNYYCDHRVTNQKRAEGRRGGGGGGGGGRVYNHHHQYSHSTPLTAHLYPLSDVKSI